MVESPTSFKHLFEPLECLRSTCLLSVNDNLIKDLIARQVPTIIINSFTPNDRHHDPIKDYHERFQGCLNIFFIKGTSPHTSQTIMPGSLDLVYFEPLVPSEIGMRLFQWAPKITREGMIAIPYDIEYETYLKENNQPYRAYENRFILMS